MRKLRRAFRVVTNRLLALFLPQHLQTPFSFSPFMSVTTPQNAYSSEEFPLTRWSCQVFSESGNLFRNVAIFSLLWRKHNGHSEVCRSRCSSPQMLPTYTSRFAIPRDAKALFRKNRPTFPACLRVKYAADDTSQTSQSDGKSGHHTSPSTQKLCKILDWLRIC